MFYKFAHSDYSLVVVFSLIFVVSTFYSCVPCFYLIS